MPVPSSAADKRAHPRYRVDLPARLCGTTVSVRNVSHAGMQLACSTMFFGFLSARLSPDEAPCEIALTLPGSGQVTLLAEVAYVNEYDDEHLIGLALRSGPEPDRLAYEAYVDSLAGSRAPLTC